MSRLVIERLLAGVSRADLSAASGLNMETLRLAEDGLKPLSESDEQRRQDGLEKIIASRVDRREPKP